jgi:hypothetical protein
MTDWIVRQWSRSGQNRLYAATPGGTDLGFLDVTTGRFHSDDLSNLPLLKHAIAEHLARVSPPVQPLEGRGGLSAGAHIDPAAFDLSSVRAGSAARQQAEAERADQGTVKHVLARLVGAKTDERAWRIGAAGEEAVAAQLDLLGPGWRVLHAIRVGTRGSDIDHVVVGPAGVFTVNAKHHPQASIWVGGDTFLVNGRRVPYIRNGRHEAARASRLLTEQTGFPVVATGVIAVVGARGGYKIKKQPTDGKVVVVARRRIRQYLLQLSPQLTPRAVEAIYEVARRSTTWR